MDKNQSYGFYGADTANFVRGRSGGGVLIFDKHVYIFP